MRTTREPGELIEVPTKQKDIFALALECDRLSSIVEAIGKIEVPEPSDWPEESISHFTTKAYRDGVEATLAAVNTIINDNGDKR